MGDFIQSCLSPHPSSQRVCNKHLTNNGGRLLVKKQQLFNIAAPAASGFCFQRIGLSRPLTPVLPGPARVCRSVMFSLAFAP